ncbi:phage major capsid protein [Singulisphaera acidiphila]|uniref:Putative phage phi-C31 gp36 major capsid-like protein n=1 Tax=Singulisphaera acidiphila (strain ATCC BAA-1392 / DSM 18658 / VKM B-2454 / MOB10) TaxID=886293 RepID=L0DH76_SINAD|nr:phage major capsid protein [Singulisphaera acidiphila]AGA28724.1 putative phage phi-C31 gp36 major capsid-like protein [Singulisphaera acidiphila DSM 18658]
MTPRLFTYSRPDQSEERSLPHHEPSQRGKYSLARALREARNHTNGVITGLEREVSDEIARRTGRNVRGFLVPWDVEVRALSTTTGAGGIPTILSGAMIDVLRAKMICGMLGAQVLPDLTGGKFAIPKKTATVSLGWLPEGGDAPTDEPVVDSQVLFTPHTTGAYVDVTRKAIDSIPNIDEVIIGDLLSAIAVEVDRGALNGLGNNNQPLGLAQNPGVAEVSFGANGGAPTLALLAAMEQTVGNANADIGKLAFATTPNGRLKLRTTEKVATSGKMLWTDSNTVLGYPAVASNQLPSNLTHGLGTGLSPIIFGNWSDLVIGLWGPVDILVNPYRFSTTGFTRYRGLQDVDVMLRHNESFAMAPDMVTT